MFERENGRGPLDETHRQTLFWASPLYADGHVYFFDTDGQTTVIEASTEHNTVAQNQLDGHLYSTAAPIDGSLIVRTDKAIYRLAGPEDE